MRKCRCGYTLCTRDRVGLGLKQGMRLRPSSQVCYEAFVECNLDGADLSEADLRGADLSGAKLEEANLARANLYDVDLSKATLRAPTCMRLTCLGLTSIEPTWRRAICAGRL